MPTVSIVEIHDGQIVSHDMVHERRESRQEAVVAAGELLFMRSLYEAGINPSYDEVRTMLDEGHAEWDDRQVIMSWPNYIDKDDAIMFGLETEHIEAMFKGRILAVMNGIREALIRCGYTVELVKESQNGEHGWVLTGYGNEDSLDSGFTITFTIIENSSERSVSFSVMGQRVDGSAIGEFRPWSADGSMWVKQSDVEGMNDRIKLFEVVKPCTYVRMLGIDKIPHLSVGDESLWDYAFSYINGGCILHQWISGAINLSGKVLSHVWAMRADTKDEDEKKKLGVLVAHIERNLKSRRLWMRPGINADYEDFDDIAGVIDRLREYAVLVHPVCKYGDFGITTALRDGLNHINLFWGDDDASPITSITGSELCALLSSSCPMQRL